MNSFFFLMFHKRIYTTVVMMTTWSIQPLDLLNLEVYLKTKPLKKKLRLLLILLINEQEQIWNFANFVEKMEGVWVGKWVENDVVIEANCVKKLWPPHSPTHLLRGEKKKLVTISTAQLNWTPILGEAMLYSFIIFLDYLSWINLVNLICWSKSVTLKPWTSPLRVHQLERFGDRWPSRGL